MKSHLALASLAILFLAAADLQAEDLFPDKGLEAAVRKEVFDKRYNEEPLTKEDVSNISQVHGKGLSIKSLVGLEHCVAVQEIDLEDNEIEDVSQLAGLKLLQSINLANNKIASIEPLAELERVQYLELSNNLVEDISALEKMTNMRSLYLSGNKIRRVRVLANLPKVWTLYLADNPVKNFRPIGKLKWLSHLDLRKTGLDDVSFLAPLTELKYVNLEANLIRDVQPLVEMASADEEKRFSPFWRIHLSDNLLDEDDQAHLDQLKELGAKIELE